MLVRPPPSRPFFISIFVLIAFLLGGELSPDTPPPMHGCVRAILVLHERNAFCLLHLT